MRAIVPAHFKNEGLMYAIHVSKVISYICIYNVMYGWMYSCAFIYALAIAGTYCIYMQCTDIIFHVLYYNSFYK